jgi:hypothetical protein
MGNELDGFMFSGTDDVLGFTGGSGSKGKKTKKKEATDEGDNPKDPKMPRHLGVALAQTANYLRSSAQVIKAEYVAKTNEAAAILTYIFGSYTCAIHVS